VRDAHPDYGAPKAGNAEAAGRLAIGLMAGHSVARIRRLIGQRQPIVRPVSSFSGGGRCPPNQTRIWYVGQSRENDT